MPFDAGKLDKLLDEAGIDVLVATSKHNVQYLLGGYRFFFFDTMDAIGTSRYLPALVYRKGKPEDAAYVGCAMETYEQELGQFWPPTLDLTWTGSKATMREAVAHIKKLGGVRRVGVEMAFLPADAEAVLRKGLSNCRYRRRRCRWSGCACARRRRRSSTCARRPSASSRRCWRRFKASASPA